MRRNRYLIDSYYIVFGYLGVLIMIASVVLLLPLLVLFAYPREARYAIDFVIPAILALVVGFSLSLLLRGRQDRRLVLRQDTIIITLGWVMAAFFSALPFLLGGQLNFTQAMFESISGWTTTGLSVVDVTGTPRIFLMHRTIMQFFGGIGIVLVMVSALSGTYGMRLYNAEGHTDRLLPNLAKSARVMMAIYCSYTAVGAILYVSFGMPWFDAINHAMAALSTGGFSTQPDSIGSYHSLPIELITIILMLLGTTNFAAHLLLVSGKFQHFFRVGEIRFEFIVLTSVTVFVCFSSLNHLYGNLSKSIRAGVFNLVSALSTTGFSTVDYNQWPPFAVFVLILLMLIGGGEGSTAGGIKLLRVHVLSKSVFWNLRRRFLPVHMVNKDYVYRPDGKWFVEDQHVSEASLFAFVYLIVFSVGVGVMTSQGYSLQSSLFEFASTIGTVGLSVGITSPTAPPVVLWTQMAGMLLGRLEIYVIFIAVIHMFRDARLLHRPH